MKRRQTNSPMHLVMLTLVSFLMCFQARAVEEDAETLAKGYVHHPANGNPFLLSDMPFGNPMPMLKVDDDKHVLEFNNLSYRKQMLDVTAADRLNGFTGGAIVNLMCDAWRIGKMTPSGATKDWSEWRNNAADDPLVRLIVTNKRDKWQTEAQIKLILGWVPVDLISVAQFKNDVSQKREQVPNEAQKSLVKDGSPQAFQGERFPQTRIKNLTSSDISTWNRSSIQYAINEMFARRGMYFKNDSVRSEFERFSWYKPNKNLAMEEIEATFTHIETANLKLLGDARSKLSGSHSK